MECNKHHWILVCGISWGAAWLLPHTFPWSLTSDFPVAMDSWAFFKQCPVLSRNLITQPLSSLQEREKSVFISVSLYKNTLKHSSLFPDQTDKFIFILCAERAQHSNHLKCKHANVDQTTDSNKYEKPKNGRTKKNSFKFIQNKVFSAHGNQTNQRARVSFALVPLPIKQISTQTCSCWANHSCLCNMGGFKIMISLSSHCSFLTFCHHLVVHHMQGYYTQLKAQLSRFLILIENWTWNKNDHKLKEYLFTTFRKYKTVMLIMCFVTSTLNWPLSLICGSLVL